MRRAALPTANQAEHIIELWRSRCFDTHDIGRIIGLPEATVASTIQAARDMARILVRGGRS